MKTADFKNNAVFGETKPAITLMLETEHTKEIRIMMKAGQEMKEHQTPFPIVVHLVSGSIDFTVNNETHKLEGGAILSLDGGVPHSLLAHSDSVVRLSLSKKDTVHRVVKVAEK